jgi:kinesin family protein 5
MPESASVKVFARFRPFNKREVALGGGADNLKFVNQSCGVEVEGKPFNFDRCFGADTQQADFYGTVARDTISDIFKGYNGTIFAYGQTGAGKTWSMMGSLADEQLRGITPRAMHQIFETIDAAPLETTFKVSVSYMEVYREVIRDLLDVRNSNLSVRESKGRGTYVEGATNTFVANEDEVYEVLQLGDAARAVASTNMNATSSRSHSVFIVKVEQQNVDGTVKTGQLNLVDLAGSEKISKTGASGETLPAACAVVHREHRRTLPDVNARCIHAGSTLEEAKKINQSLSALSNVIR